MNFIVLFFIILNSTSVLITLSLQYDMVQRTLRTVYVSVSFLSSKIEKALLRLQYDENVNAGLIDCIIMIMIIIGGVMMMMVLEMMAMRVLR